MLELSRSSIVCTDSDYIFNLCDIYHFVLLILMEWQEPPLPLTGASLHHIEKSLQVLDLEWGEENKGWGGGCLQNWHKPWCSRKEGRGKDRSNECSIN